VRRVLFGLCLAIVALPASGPAHAETRSAKAWLGLAAGSAAASETVLAADIASLFPQDSDTRVLPILGDAGAGNLSALLENPAIDLAFVAAPALAPAAEKDKSLSGKLELVLKLPPQEVYLLAKPDALTLADLSGKDVSFGPEGSASAATAAVLFKALGIEVKASHLDEAAALERLKQGTLAAVVILGGKPSPQIEAVPAAAGIHVLPIPFGTALEAAAFLPTSLSAADYPNLIQEGSEVATVATGMVLLAAAKDRESRQRIDRLVAALFPHFSELQAQGRHPKWREVNLAANLAGFKRTRAAEVWLQAGPDADATPVAVSASAASTTPLPGMMTKEQQEALFTRFIEWQRGKER
jgi:TRAP transporter TAXI family solute receptor